MSGSLPKLTDQLTYQLTCHNMQFIKLNLLSESSHPNIRWRRFESHHCHIQFLHRTTHTHISVKSNTTLFFLYFLYFYSFAPMNDNRSCIFKEWIRWKKNPQVFCQPRRKESRAIWLFRECLGVWGLTSDYPYRSYEYIKILRYRRHLGKKNQKLPFCFLALGICINGALGQVLKIQI